MCFREKGFAGGSISDICKQADMSPGHLYHFFPTKADIIAVIALQDREAASAVFDQLGEEENLLEAILALLSPSADMGEFGLDGSLAFDVLAEAGRNEGIHASARSVYVNNNQRLAALIKAQQERGRVAKNVDPKGAALSITALYEGLASVGVVHTEDELASAYPSVKAMITAVLDGAGAAGRPQPLRKQKSRKKK